MPVYQENYSTNPKFGFRYLKPASPVPAVAPVGMDANAPPAVMDTSPTGAEPYHNVDSTAPSREVSPELRQNVASSYGYTKGTQNPNMMLGALGAFAGVPGMSFLQGEDSESTFGQPGTYDAQGNVFGDDGIAYDPISGDVGNYKDMGTWWDSKKSGYDSLRDKGFNPVAAGLGDYSNSPHYISNLERRFGITPANKAGIMDTMGMVRSNTLGKNIFDNEENYLRDSFEGYNITPEMLGLDTNLLGKTHTGIEQLLENPQATFADIGSIGTPDAKAGQVVKTQDGSIGVVNDSGQIQTAQGTLVQMEGENLNDAGQSTFIQPSSGTSWNDIVDNAGYDPSGEDKDWEGGGGWWNKGGPVHAATGGYLGPPTQQGGMRRPDAGGKGGGIPQQPVVQQPIQQPVQPQQPVVQQQPIIQQQPVQPAGGK